ncbi:hypothetical protein [Thermogemmatispora tikiterensis]|uniref:Glycosyltransferase RgtA/B/C/D-like domain-containing protein n=1 Tax=Thermogemmatispora tikiterensis TaxID=1825093 RepID=A0A328VIB7_9CHLR|nr:hypothetical protein [Thermogemmatispora tikiterensis]RAQ97456.1 hypothetical protein A4R35_18100 [Thermogemmatispora tikiterensis]
MIIILLSSLLRFSLILLGWPSLDSDEGTMGLMALHIAYQGAHPLVFYGQDYLAPIDAYLAAFFFLIWGPSVVTLRLSVLLLFCFFLIQIYLLTSLVYNKPLALCTLLIVGAGPGEVVFRELEAAGGSPDVLFFCSCLLLVTCKIVLSRQQRLAVQEQAGLWDGLALGGWGLLAGVSIWSDPLVLPFVGMAFLLLLESYRRQLKLALLLILLAGLLVGLAPEIIYKVTVPPSPTRLALLGPGYHEPAYPPVTASSGAGATGTGMAIQASPMLQIAGALLVSLPLATGGNAICTLGSGQAWPPRGDPQTQLCTVLHGAWSLGYLVLWFLAAGLALKAWWPWRRRDPNPESDERSCALEHARQGARLMVLGGAGGTLFLYCLFPPAALTPWPSSRYLVGLIISIPAVLFPLWCLACSSSQRLRCGLPLPVARLGSMVAVVMAIATWWLGSGQLLAQAPGVQVLNKEQQALINFLLKRGATRIYTDYWTCDRIAFQSTERIICSVLDAGLQPGLNRYPPYSSLVQAAPALPCYVFPVGSPQDLRLQQRIARGYRYSRLTYMNYAIYEPLLYI